MILNMTGGGMPLNFKVVGNPKPDSPTENTIWVNTDAEITGWEFNFAEPSNPTEGMVWFGLDANSNISFNVLKKNGIHLRPKFAKQYVGGAFSEKPFQLYTNGAWASAWDGYYFKNGEQYTDITGGWVASTGANSSVKIGTTLSITSNGYDDTYDNAVKVGPVNQVDLTNVTYLYAMGESTGNYDPYFIAHPTKASHTSSAVTHSVEFTGGTKELYVGDLEGMYYIYFSGAGAKAGPVKATISEVWGV